MANIRLRDYLPQDEDKVSFLHWKDGEVLAHEELTYGHARLVLLDLLVNPQYRLSGGRPGNSGLTMQSVGFGLYDFSLETVDKRDPARLTGVNFQGRSVWREFYSLTEVFVQLVYALGIEGDAWNAYNYEGGIWAFRDALFALVLGRLFTDGRSLTSEVIRAIMEAEPDLCGRFIQFYVLVSEAIAHRPLAGEDWLTLESAQHWAALEGDDRRQFVTELYERVSAESRKQWDAEYEESK